MYMNCSYLKTVPPNSQERKKEKITITFTARTLFSRKLLKIRRKKNHLIYTLWLSLNRFFFFFKANSHFLFSNLNPYLLINFKIS
jgi:hypothetical protein